LGHYASAKGIPPGGINDEIIDGFMPQSARFASPKSWALSAGTLI
jgi:hypothetical protein